MHGVNFAGHEESLHSMRFCQFDKCDFSATWAAIADHHPNSGIDLLETTNSNNHCGLSTDRRGRPPFMEHFRSGEKSSLQRSEAILCRCAHSIEVAS